MSWCSVRPSRSATRVRLRLAASVALRIASGTSRALPWPKPTRPFWSPMTTSAAKPKRLPPLTTFATRLMWTSLSTNSLSRSSRSLLRSRPPRSRSPAMVPILEAQGPCPRVILEAQSALARGIRERLDAAVIEVTATIEDHLSHSIFHGALGEQFSDRLRRIDIGSRLAALAHRLLERRGGSQSLALQVIDDLGIDVLRRAEHRQARSTAAGTAHRKPDTLLAPGIRNLCSRHDRLRYFFLPSLRKMNSSTYFTPLPL